MGTQNLEAVLVPTWAAPPEYLALTTGEVHLWQGALDSTSAAAEEMELVLSEDERARAERIVLNRTREWFVAGRYLLRTILGGYLGIPAKRVELTYGPHGKPELAPRFSSSLLMFSLSHSRDRALVALTQGRAIGVDLEAVRPLSDTDGLVARIFSATERAEWLGLPPEARLDGFYRAWTAKEAWLKARATGLTWPPDWFSVSLVPGTPLRLVEVKGDPGAPGLWELASLEPAPGYRAALAVEGHGWQAAFFACAYPQVQI